MQPEYLGDISSSHMSAHVRKLECGKIKAAQAAGGQRACRRQGKNKLKKVSSESLAGTPRWSRDSAQFFSLIFAVGENWKCDDSFYI